VASSKILFSSPLNSLYNNVNFLTAEVCDINFCIRGKCLDICIL
jgi:hypothetical protein